MRYNCIIIVAWNCKIKIYCNRALSMHICLNIVEVLYCAKVNANILTIGGGSNCNWYELLDVTSINVPFGVDRG